MTAVATYRDVYTKKVIPVSDKFYKELIQKTSTYNGGLASERKLRLPFLDSQTGVAQSHSSLWQPYRSRAKGQHNGQVYAYPAKRWKKKKRSFPLPEVRLTKLTDIETGEAGTRVEATATKPDHSAKQRDMHQISAVENPAALSSKEDSRDQYDDNSMASAGGASYTGGGYTYYDDWEAMEEPLDAGEIDARHSDSSDFEDTYIKKRKKKPTKAKGGRGKKKDSDHRQLDDSEKPYSCELCGARYKTRPGLSYHVTHSHNNPKKKDTHKDKDKEREREREQQQQQQHQQQQQPPPPSMPMAPQHPTMPQPPTMLHPPAPQMSHLQAQLQRQTPPPQFEHHSMDGSSPGPGYDYHQQQQQQQQQQQPQQQQQQQSQQQSEPVMHNMDMGNKPRPPGRMSSATPPAPGPDGGSSGGSVSKYCDFCLGDAHQNKKTGSREELVSCADCGRSGHPSCLQFTANMIISVKKYPWQCIECKSCGLCGTSDNDDQLLFCDDCDRGYHMYCLKPPLSEPPEGSWSCHLCVVEFYGGKKTDKLPNTLADTLAL